MQQGLILFLIFAHIIFKIAPKLGLLHKGKLYKATTTQIKILGQSEKITFLSDYSFFPQLGQVVTTILFLPFSVSKKGFADHI